MSHDDVKFWSNKKNSLNRAVICQKQISVEGNGYCCHRPSSNWEANHSLNGIYFKTRRPLSEYLSHVHIGIKGNEITDSHSSDNIEVSREMKDAYNGIDTCRPK